MSPTYPHLVTDWDRIAQVAFAEEDAFRKTLQAGTQIFDTAADDVKQSGGSSLSGERAFQLHDTYGFPIDLTLEMAAEQGLQVDEQGFRGLMAEQRERAKADARAKKGAHGDTAVYRACSTSTAPPSGWPTRPSRPSRARLPCSAGERPCRASPRARSASSCSTGPRSTPSRAARSPTPARSSSTAASLEVIDVQRPIKGLVVHQVRVVEGELDPAREVHARVDPEWRIGARQAHSGTHVVHAALREVLGPTALQSGSYNRPGYLRLDFGWTQGLTPAQVRDIELVSQQALRADLAVSGTT